jgi:hypothetical protein
MIYDFSNIVGLEGVTNTYSTPINTNILLDMQIKTAH